MVQKLRAEADKVLPSKLSKRKHQINSLYHAAKMKVIALLVRLSPAMCAFLWHGHVASFRRKLMAIVRLCLRSVLTSMSERARLRTV